VKLLDLFCCEGGASMGYYRAGFDVFGVDIFEDYSQKRYPFPSWRGDALAYVRKYGHLFAAIAASPPCQHASAGTRAQDRSRYPRLIEPTREALIDTGKPYVIENVRGADLHEPVELCGCMFDLVAVDTDGILLHLQRARRFETNFPLAAPRPCDHSDHEWVGGSYGGARRDKYEAKYKRHGGYVPSIPVQRDLLGIDWMTQKGMHQSIPPAYTEWVGSALMRHLTERAGVSVGVSDNGGSAR
jgi:DNA (cytosine-5)-methyltransferase 1